MHVLIIGGTGFIGYHIVQQLLASKHEVTLLCRTPDKAKETFGDTVHYLQGDLNFFHQIPFDKIFNGIDALIYAVGTDERDVPTEDPYKFFYDGNVTTCINLLEKAKAAKVKRTIILGSMFTHLDNELPELNLSLHHPYIRSRKEQQKEVMALADEDFTVNLVEIPFVFGHTPGHDSLWESLVNYIRVANPLIVTPGGTNCISVESLAKAIVGILNHINESSSIPVGDENLTWTDILDRIGTFANTKEKNIHMLQKGLFSDLTRLGGYFHEFFGMRSGLDQKNISTLIIHEAFFDTEDIKRQLHYEGGDLDKAFEETVNSCPKTMLINNLQRSIDWLNDSTLKTLKQLNKITTPNK